MKRAFLILTLLMAGGFCAQSGANLTVAPVLGLSVVLFHLLAVLTWTVLAVGYWLAALGQVWMGFRSWRTREAA